MKKCKYLLAIAVSLMVLSGCRGATEVSESVSNAAESAAEATSSAAETVEEAEALEEGKVDVSFENGGSALFECADGWSNGSVFDCTWRRENVVFEEGVMRLVISDDSYAASKTKYAGGEYRSKGFYGYGMYEVTMKAIKNSGVVSSFFTYTGPTDGNPWDEIDVEILGKDTTKVQFNYYTNGVGGHEYMYDLGFDAAEDFHTYGFSWSESEIVWYVDGEAVYSATENLPKVEGKIMMNAWNGIGVDGWLGAFDDSGLPLAAEYKGLKFEKAE